MSGDITENFSYREFKPTGSLDTWVPTNQWQKMLIDRLASQLQIVRTRMPAGSSMKITMGVRTAGDYARLKASGFHPSETSDHYCGEVVSVDPQSPNFKKFGPMYFFSVGAADIVPVGMDIELFFKMSVDCSVKGFADFGQIIFEHDPIKGMKWVHFANNSASVFSPKIGSFLGREKYLVTTDGGKSYVKYSA